MRAKTIFLCFILFQLSFNGNAILNDYMKVEYTVENSPTNLQSASQSGSRPSSIRSGRPSPSRPSPSRPSRPAPRPSPTPSRPASRPSPSPTSRPAARPSPTSRPASRPNPSPTSRPAPRPSTYRPAPAPASTARPAPHTTRRIPSIPSTYRPPSIPSTFRPQPPPTTQRVIITTRQSFFTTQRPAVSPSTTQRVWTSSRTTYRPPTPIWTPAQSRTLAPPLAYTTGRPYPYPPSQQGSQVWLPSGSGSAPKTGSSIGISSIFKSLTGGSKGTPGIPSVSGSGSGTSSKMATLKKLATALYGAYKGHKLKQKVNRNQYHSYSPYYGRNYYYGNRYYQNRNPHYRMTCYYYVPANDPSYDLYYEDQNRVTEIVYECDAQYERCCGTVDCCRGSYVVNGRGVGTGQSMYIQNNGYPDYNSNQRNTEVYQPTSNQRNTEVYQPPVVDENSQSFESYAESFNFENVSDEDFLSFNETIYANNNETIEVINYLANHTESNLTIQTLTYTKSNLHELN